MPPGSATITADVLRIYVPPPRAPAARWIQLLWEWNGYPATTPIERILPHGLVEISWNLTAPHRFCDRKGVTVVPRAALIGARDLPYYVDTQPESHLFGIVLRPGTAGRLLDVGMHELTGRFVALDDLAVGSALERQIGEARSADERKAAALAFFSRLPAPQAREASMLLSTWSSSDGRTQSVKALRSSLGISSPTFVNRVREQLGLRPAQMRQVLMFREAVTQLAKSPPSITEVAHCVGYCDQAHLNRAFRNHSGLAPGQFSPSMPDHPFNLAEPNPDPVLEFDAPLSFDPRRPPGPRGH